MFVALFPFLIALMLAFMFWRAAYRLRADRIVSMRSLRRVRGAALTARDGVRARVAARHR